jgi:hypothetical protein
VNRARPADALLAGLATLSVVLPLTSLFETPDWVPPAVLLVAVVGLTGIALRTRSTSAWVVGAGQVAALLAVASLTFVRDQLWFGLPGPEAIRTGWLLLHDAYDNIQTHSAPAPTTPGTVFALAGLIAVTALAVDVLAVTLSSPTVAGLPLLAAYLTAATNAGEGLAAFYFVVPAALWVTMVGRQGVGSVRRWATAVSRSETEHQSVGAPDDVALDFASLGRVLGVGAIAAAVLLTPLIPHLPTTFLAQGLGRSTGSGNGSGIRLTSTLDVAKNLGDRSDRPVLVYTAPLGASQVPLRVDVLSNYENGQWTEAGRRVVTPTDGRLDAPAAAALSSSGQMQLHVVENRISAPQLALPDLTTFVNAGGAPLAVDAQGTVRVRSRVPGYTADFLVLDPTAGEFDGDGRGLVGQGYLALDNPSLDAVRAALAAAVPAGSDHLTTARDIQRYLRSDAFRYSLTLDPAAPGEDPITAFLTTKKGYCVQFATAMVMMARAAGIPARMAIGFRAGTGAEGTYTVVASDAHAWPELYFPRLGWVRFEPTPGSRSGAAPGYTLAPVGAGPQVSPTAAGQGATPTPTPSSQQVDPLAIKLGNRSSGGVVGQWVTDHRTALTALAVLLILGLLLPAGAWSRRRRRRRRAADAAARAEAEWLSLLGRLGDVGIAPPPGATPRQTGQYVREAAYLGDEPEAALGRVVATIERGRYAAPSADLPELRMDARSVWRAAARTRGRGIRLRAALLPSEGVRAWSSLADALLGVLRWAGRLARRPARRRQTV